MMGDGPVLELDKLGVSFVTPRGEVAAVHELSLTVDAGECLGVVGESGAGKSQAFLAVMGLLPPNARVSGRARFGAVELIGRRSSDLNGVRGARLAMIFQDPGSALTPHMTVGDQIAEPMVRHSGLSWRAARRQALELLDCVRITDAARRFDQYPHELSGGMRQRVMIAMALACDPALLIADEPTTALDVTVQAQILALLTELRRSRGMAMVLITHDLGVVAGTADRVAVLQKGRLVEVGPVSRVLKTPSHPYTRMLLQMTPRIRTDATQGLNERLEPSHRGEDFLLQVSRLSVDFNVRRRMLGRRAVLRALQDVELGLRSGETLGIVGESGCGKSTLARAIVRLIEPTAGSILWMGKPLHGLRRRDLRAVRSDLQIVFQDPLSSLDPRMTVGEILAEPLLVHRRDLDRRSRRSLAADMLTRVGLTLDMIDRYPHELSGGQCQRVAIARAMILKPRVLVCDEPISSLDVPVQQQIVSLLVDMQRELGTSIIFITHNLAFAQRLCDRVLVLYLGRMMELAPAGLLYAQPLHPYTRGLLAAVPVPDPDVQPGRFARAIAGELPSPLAPPTGCVFRTRCPHAARVCSEQQPAWEALDDARRVACHRWRELYVDGTASPLSPVAGLAGS